MSVTGAPNIDWEDLASYQISAAHDLLIADIGDNDALRESVNLYVVAEPDPAGGDTTVAARSIAFQYPDGPRDAEAVAVDAEAGAVYVLSKRTISPELYEVPFSHASLDADELVAARYLGPITSLPRPTDEDLEHAVERQDWHWQPTAMDFSPDGTSATILTYRAVYSYERNAGESWYDALQSEPRVRPLGDIKDAESMCLADGAIFVTVEAANPPLLRFDR